MYKHTLKPEKTLNRISYIKEFQLNILVIFGEGDKIEGNKILILFYIFCIIYLTILKYLRKIFPKWRLRLNFRPLSPRRSSKVYHSSQINY